MELALDDRNEALQRRGVPVSPRHEQTGHVPGARRFTARLRIHGIALRADVSRPDVAHLYWINDAAPPAEQIRR
jgi:hypothetical protein